MTLRKNHLPTLDGCNVVACDVALLIDLIGLPVSMFKFHLTKPNLGIKTHEITMVTGVSLSSYHYQL